jgi:hypothetical protein
MLGIPTVVTIVFLAYYAFPWILIFIGIHLEPNPPRPQITYGEFPFRLEYEINGERKVIQDSLICEFDGFGADEGRGKYREWKQRLASGNERVTLLKVNDNLEIYYSPGSAKYYMDDMESGGEYKHGYPDALVSEKRGKITSNRLILADQLLKEYGIKLISWDASQPLKNNFVASQK